MASTNSSTGNEESVARFSAPELVSSHFTGQVLADWTEYIEEQMDRDCQSLITASDWLYEEALGYLCKIVLKHLGVDTTIIESLSLIDNNPNGSGLICELVLVWGDVPFLDPGDVLEGATVLRMNDFPVPPKIQFLTNISVRRMTVAQWAYVLSSVADDLPEKEL